MPVPLLAAKKGFDLVRAGRRALAEWKALPPDERERARAQAEQVKTLSGELGRALGERAGERAGRRDAADRTRDVRTLVDELAEALRRLGATMPDPGYRPSRKVRFAARAVARAVPSAGRKDQGATEEETMDDRPPAEFLEQEADFGVGRRDLRAGDPFWDLIPESVEWKVFREGQPSFDLPRTRQESLVFAWPDGRIESFGSGPHILMTRKYDSFFPTGRTEAGRDFQVDDEGESVADLYGRYDPPPWWIALERREFFREEEPPRTDLKYITYAVVEPPGPPDPSARELPRTLDREGGSLEGTGWVDYVPPAPPTPRSGGLAKRLGWR